MKKTFYYYLYLTPLLLLLPLIKAHQLRFNASLTLPTTDTADKSTLSPPIEGKEYRIKKIVIDAGHGGYDSGCVGEAGVEKKNTLAIALKVGQKIKATYPSVEIIYTREKDEFIELHRRADIANKAKADLFISIHCNSTDEGNTATGTETYVLGMHKKHDNFAVSKRENSSILLENDYEKQYDGFDPNSNEAYIIFSMFQNAYLEKSILFAKTVEESFKNNASRKSLGVKQAGFMVLKNTTMPSVLIETGFLNNRNEGAFISSNEGQETIAEAILLAFSKYKKTVENGEESLIHVKEAPVEVKYEAPQVKKGLAKTVNVANMPPSKPSNTEGVVYKIQLASSRQNMRQSAPWNTLTNLEIIYDNTIYRYYKTGLNTLNDANNALKQLKNQGFHDAFIVISKNGQR